MRRFFALAVTMGLVMSIGPQQPPFPQVSGTYHMTKEWSLQLQGNYSRRIEEGSLVLWRRGLTCWIVTWDKRPGDTPQSTYRWRRESAPKSAMEFFEQPDGKPARFAYLLHEMDDGAPRYALYTFTFGTSGHVQMAIYFDDKQDLSVAKDLWLSVNEGAVK
jgi:hypothetical protein